MNKKITPWWDCVAGKWEASACCFESLKIIHQEKLRSEYVVIWSCPECGEGGHAIHKGNTCALKLESSLPRSPNARWPWATNSKGRWDSTRHTLILDLLYSMLPWRTRLIIATTNSSSMNNSIVIIIIWRNQTHLEQNRHSISAISPWNLVSQLFRALTVLAPASLASS